MLHYATMLWAIKCGFVWKTFQTWHGSLCVGEWLCRLPRWMTWCSIDSTKAKHLGVCEVSHPMMRLESACYIAKNDCGINLFQGGNWWDGGAKLSRILWGQLRFWAFWRRQNKNQKRFQKKGGCWISLGIGNPHAKDVITGYVIYFIYTDTVLIVSKMGRIGRFSWL